MNTAQEVGFGALIGGAATVLTNLGLRYFADMTITQPTTVGEQPARPFLYEHAPLLGLVPGAVATFAAYKWMGGAPAAVACAITSLFAATAPPIDEWVQDARAEKNSKEEAAVGAGDGVHRYGSYPQRLAALGRKVGRVA